MFKVNDVRIVLGGLAVWLIAGGTFALDEDTLTQQSVTKLDFSGGASNIKKWDCNPFESDEDTILLLHFDDDGKVAIKDSSGKLPAYNLRSDPRNHSGSMSAWPLPDEIGHGSITSFTKYGGLANWVSGRFGMAIRFVDSLVHIPNAARFLNTERGTMEAWIFPFDAYEGGIVGYGRIGEGPVIYTEKIDGKYCVRGYWPGPAVNKTEAFEVPLKEWSHVAMVWDGSRMSLYINGEEKDSADVGVKKRKLSKVELPCYIGHSWPVGRKGRGFSGMIDEVRVSTVARKPNELMWFEGEFHYAVRARRADKAAWEQAFDLPVAELLKPLKKKRVVGVVPEGFSVLGKKGRKQTGVVDTTRLGDVSTAEADVQDRDAGAKVMPELPKADTDSGYIISSAHYEEEVYMNTIPKAEQLEPMLKLLASRGEYEPVTFSVKAIDPIEVSTVKIGDFVNNNGDVIGRENVDVRSVRYFKIKYGEKYLFKPKLLEKNWPLKLLKNQTQRFWLTVRVPDDASAGLYTSRVVVSVKGKSDREIPVVLRVLPIKLAKSKIDYGTFFLGDLLSHPESSKWVYVENLEKIFINYHEHGLNTIFMFGVNPKLTMKEDGHVDVNLEETETILNAYRVAGLDGPIGIDLRDIIRWCEELEEKKEGDPSSRHSGYQASQRTIDALRDIVKQLIEIAEEKQWPDIYFAPGEELRSPNTRMYFLYWSQFLVDIPGYRTAWIGDETLIGIDRGRQYDEWVDMRIPLNLTPAAIEDSKKSGDVHWLYNQGWSRLFWGYHLLRTEVTGYLQWADQWHRTDPYGELHSRSMSWAYTYPSPDGPIPTLVSERSREGIDDVRYVRTLEALIDKASASKDNALKYKADQGRRTIKFILDQIGYGRSITGLSTSQTDPHDLDALRWRIVRDIMDIQDALQGDE